MDLCIEQGTSLTDAFGAVGRNSPEIGDRLNRLLSFRRSQQTGEREPREQQQSELSVDKHGSGCGRWAAGQHIQKEIIAADLTAFENDFSPMSVSSKSMNPAERRSWGDRRDELQSFQTQRPCDVGRGVAAANDESTGRGLGNEAIQHLAENVAYQGCGAGW